VERERERHMVRGWWEIIRECLIWGKGGQVSEMEIIKPQLCNSGIIQE